MNPVILARTAELKEEDKKDIIAAIGLAGSLEGSLVISSMGVFAANVVSKMLCCEVAPGSQDVMDGMGEVANMLAGGFKTRVAGNLGYNFELSIPTVISGGSPLHVSKPHKADIVQLCVDCGESKFELYLFYTIKSSNDGISDFSAKKAAAQSARAQASAPQSPAGENPEDLLKGLIG